MTAADRAELEGVSTERAPQIVAGALVAEASMRALSVESVDICPWALREGLILRKLDSEADGTALIETLVGDPGRLVARRGADRDGVTAKRPVERQRTMSGPDDSQGEHPTHLGCRTVGEERHDRCAAGGRASPAPARQQ